MTVEAGIEVDLDVDLDKPLICEIQWDNGIKSFPCNRPASWIGIAHDEVSKHDYSQLLICGRCVTLAQLKNNCEECDVPVLKDLRRL